jgi:hypothetical protein
VDGVGSVGEGLWSLSLCVSHVFSWWCASRPVDVDEVILRSSYDGCWAVTFFIFLIVIGYCFQ